MITKSEFLKKWEPTRDALLKDRVAKTQKATIKCLEAIEAELNKHMLGSPEPSITVWVLSAVSYREVCNVLTEAGFSVRADDRRDGMQLTISW